MAILPILKFPDSRLRTIAKPIINIDNKIQQLSQDMLETMYQADGIGLAATQVNHHVQLVVMDLSEERNNPLIFINPKLKIIDNEQVPFNEGCLSVPEFKDEILRAKSVEITALNLEGNEFKIIATDLLAVCIQHECDHLNGKLFVDYLSNLKRNRLRKKLTKISKLD